jgi:hypothetical protein
VRDDGGTSTGEKKRRHTTRDTGTREERAASDKGGTSTGEKKKKMYHEGHEYER